MINKAHFLLIAKISILTLVVIIIFAGCAKKSDNQIKQKRDYMIVDQLENAEKYFDLQPAFEKAFKFLRQENLAELELKKYELDGDRLFCSIDKVQGRSRDEAKLEAHKKYIDIQYVIAGDEEMGWKQTSTCKQIAQQYDSKKDIGFFNDEPQTWKKVPPGYFTIFFPDDSHAPVVGEGEIH